MKNKEILILGAGVSGLSTGILLLKNGYKVTIWAKDLPPNTTSSKAAAVWEPYLCFPIDKVIPWARSTFRYFQEEIVNDPKSGCVYKEMTELFKTLQPSPWWEKAYPGKVERPSTKELPSGYTDAYRFETVVIDTSIYMSYLLDKFSGLQGLIKQKEIGSIAEAFQSYDLAINCTGLGSRELFNDQNVYPVRGQMVKIKASGFNEVVVSDTDQDSFSLVVPRTHDIMLGGTAQENNWSEEIDPKNTEEILKNIKSIAPALVNIEVIGESVGLRPARNEVRLVEEKFGDKIVIHNYGHGGGGFTLSWGCAQEVVGLVDKVFN